MDKRTFLKNSGIIGLSSIFMPQLFSKQISPNLNQYPSQPFTDEDFWLDVRNGYNLTKDYINLENGYYCIQPLEILDNYIKHIQEVNLQGAHYLRTVQFENKNKVRDRLAELAGCSNEELIITRNTTESLDMIISGTNWKAGDEAIMANQDYGAMLDMFQQVALRHGMVNKLIDIPMNPISDEEIVSLYEKAITPKTKLLMVCHMVNITGQILPVKKICDMAHQYNVQVIVDGAHAFAHIEFKISELNCDYYGASLHKWLSAPLGAGILYVKKENINKIWPLFAENGKTMDDISRLNHTGTIPVHTDLAINNAIDYYLKIGIKRKEERLRFLQNYWVTKVKHLQHIIINTPDDLKRSCAIANVGVKDLAPAELAEILLKKYKIYTVAIDGKGVKGCRITPNIYNTTQELDIFVKALEEIR